MKLTCLDLTFWFSLRLLTARIYAQGYQRRALTSYGSFFWLMRSLLLPLILVASKGWSEDDPLHPIPRTVIALYDSQFQNEIRFLNLHQLAEMPLNHLGILLSYHDIQTGLPDIKESEDILGVLTWFPPTVNVKDPRDYINWAIEVVEAGKKFVVIENPGFSFEKGNPTPTFITNRFWEKLGLQNIDIEIDQTYSVEIVYADPLLTQFERRYQGVLPIFSAMKPISPEVRSHLILQRKEKPSQLSHLITTHPNGGYAASGYTIYKPPETGEWMRDIRQWYINPFAFFRLAFDTDRIPKPDTTTLAGRRLYYSHIDGDGWNNVSEIENEKKERRIAAEVILQTIVRPNPDLPVTVAPIAADMDLNWYGTIQNRKVAEDFFKLAHVEVGCHTFTHPFDWLFFAHYKPEYEAPYLPRYPAGGWQHRGVTALVKEAFSSFSRKYEAFDTGAITANDEGGIQFEIGKLMPGYSRPRAYALQPFDIDLEVFGAIKEVDGLTQDRRLVKLYQWSGNCLPFAQAIALTREAGVRNINGGDTRFDFDYHSYGWVSAIGRHVKNQQQIYSSNSNENTYTDMWTSRFYSFNQLIETFKNTETPIRIKPMNLYYHTYSGEKFASLNALLENLTYIRAQQILPIRASHFAAIADGFYQTKIHQITGRRWQIQDRGALQTIRFDYGTLLGVDFERSRGVIGQCHFQGSLYVYLDEAEKLPIIELKSIQTYYEEPPEPLPYLIHSHWILWELHRSSATSFSFRTQGFGAEEMVWYMPEEGLYQILIESQKEKQLQESETRAHLLEVKLDVATLHPLTIQIDKKR